MPPPSSCLPFKLSSAKLGILHIEPVHSTLCPSITSTRSTSKFHLHTFQYNVGGAVMFDAITYGKDRMLKKSPGLFSTPGAWSTIREGAVKEGGIITGSCVSLWQSLSIML